MSKEYIEREALCKACGESIVKCNLCVAKEIPASDVVEVVHGRWEWREEWDTDEVAHTATLKSCGWYCTECGIELGDYLTKETGERHFIDDDFFTPCLKHCPNCGARMDGE